MSKSGFRIPKSVDHHNIPEMEVYHIGKPKEQIFPYNDTELLEGPPKGAGKRNSQEFVYPDFMQWHDAKTKEYDVDKSRKDTLNDALYLNKGYFEGSHVSNEYHSARNFVHAGLGSSDISRKVLQELSKHISNSYRRRNLVINKISPENRFRLPPRVTLTAVKRETWLNDLANPSIELYRIGNKIPYGIKNKSLVDVLCNKKVPMNRALWFTKCVMLNEINTLKRKQSSSKHSPSSSQVGISSELLEMHWLQEWTQQLVDYVFKFSKEMNNVFSEETKQQYMTKLSYLLNYIRALYVEDLIYKGIFLSSCVNCLREGLPTKSFSIIQLSKLSFFEGENEFFEKYFSENEIILHVRFVILTIVKMFWKEIIHLDYLSKELSEQLLLNYFFIEKIPCNSKHAKRVGTNKVLNASLKSKLLSITSESIKFLFKYNTFVFIIPNSWLLVKESLYNILLDDITINETEAKEIKNQLNLIKYRNESMMLNMNQVPNTESIFSVSQSSSNGDFFSVHEPLSPVSRLDNPSSNGPLFELGNDNYLFTRNEADILNVIDQLDRIRLKDWLADLVKPVPSASEENGSWKVFLKLMIYWAVTEERCSLASRDGVLIICNFLKRVEHNFISKNPKNTKTMYENEIFEIVYDLGCQKDLSFNKEKLYVLINELYQLKVITISAYLRKLIASGIFFLPENESTPTSEEKDNLSVKTHLEILQNLPVINNRQCDSILTKWSKSGFNFKERFETGKGILTEKILEQISNSKADIRFDEVMSFFKDLQVGLKFLLINWFTDQFKHTISDSARLIHFTPALMTKLYYFYSVNDNLTVFFKVILKFVLNNETKMVIYYLDTLYLMSRLIMKHFKLIKVIDNNNESTSIGYELFKLLVINYRDLLTRDINCFNFESVWDFIDKSVRKDESCGENKFKTKSEYSSKPKNMMNSLSQDIAESPVKINSKTFIQRPDECYSYVVFRKDLDGLLRESETAFLLGSIQDLLGVANVPIEIDDDSVVLVKTLCYNILLTMLNTFGKMLREAEICCLRSLRCLNILLMKENSSLDEEFSHFISEVHKRDSRTDVVCLYIEKLLAFEVYDIKQVLKIVREIYTGTGSETMLSELSLALVLDSDKEFNLPDEELLFLNLSRSHYRENYMPELVDLILREIRMNRTQTIERKQTEVHGILLQGAIFFTKFFIDALLEHLEHEETIKLLNALLKNPKCFISQPSDLPKLANIANEFNLPLCQAFLVVLLKMNTSSTNKNEERYSLTMESMELFLSNLSFPFLKGNSYFGELFKFVDWKSQLEILTILEQKVLKETKFEYSSESLTVLLTSKHKNVNLLPILRDYFEKFSISSKHLVATSSSFFDELNNFSVKLLDVANKEVSLTSEIHEDIYNLIAIFIRMLIIHKVTLTTRVLERGYSNLSLVTNLICLLNSTFLSGENQKLKVLLYDLLLLMKTSVTQGLSQNSLRTLNHTSPKDSLTHTESDMEHYSRQKNNMHVQQHSHPVEDASDFSRNLSLLSVFKLPEPTLINLLKSYADESSIQCLLMLDDKELQNDGDIHMLNDSDFQVLSIRKKPVNSSPSFMEESVVIYRDVPLHLNSFEVLESSIDSINENFLNLLLFDAYLTRENPP